MPLSSSVLAAALKTEIENIAGIQIETPEELEAFCNAVATAIVSHITTSAVVNGTAAVTTPHVPAPVTGTVS
jgi:hypothetical protein